MSTTVLRDSLLTVVAEACGCEPPMWVADVTRVAMDRLVFSCTAADQSIHDKGNHECNGMLGAVVAWAAYEIGEERTEWLGRELLATAKLVHDETQRNAGVL